MRLQTGCKKISRKEYIDRLEPLFLEAFAKAKSINATIPNDVKLFMCDDKSANAFATGRKTICLTIGFLDYTELVMYSSRQNEFLADEFAYKCGFGDDLAEVLDSFDGSGVHGLWANLVSIYPNIDDRIAKLQELGLSYIRY